MIIIIKPDASISEIDFILDQVQKVGLEFTVINNDSKTVVMTQPSYDINSEVFKSFPKVDSVISLNEDYKLVYKNINNLETLISLDDISIGGKNVVLMAGPCAVESWEQIDLVASELKKAGIKILRAGTFKYRTDPYSFQGLGRRAVEMLSEIKNKYNLKIISEVLDPKDFELISSVADILQIGARNMHNVSLLKEAGKINKPVLLKRGYAATLKEFLFAAEYILIGGNKNVILCERGIRTFTDYTRNTLDLSIIPAIKQRSHLPLIVDPSHATGNRDYVIPMSLAAIAAGADGLLLEVHHNPELAYSDSQQSLRLEQFKELIVKLAAISKAVDRKLDI